MLNGSTSQAGGKEFQRDGLARGGGEWRASIDWRGGIGWFFAVFVGCVLFWRPGLGEEVATNGPPPLRALGDSRYQLGAVVLDKAERSVRFPAEMYLDSGLIEYLLVATNGKAYESLLATSAQPYHIHLAMLLIGAKGAADTPALREAPIVPFHVNRRPGDTNPPPPGATGDSIAITLSWTNGGAVHEIPASDALRDLMTKTNAAGGPWTYNGSRVMKGSFLAQRDGSIVAVIDDLDALVNNPRAGHDNDQIWEINSNQLPPLHTPVEVTFKLKGNP